MDTLPVLLGCLPFHGLSDLLSVSATAGSKSGIYVQPFCPSVKLSHTEQSLSLTQGSSPNFLSLQRAHFLWRSSAAITWPHVPLLWRRCHDTSSQEIYINKLKITPNHTIISESSFCKNFLQQTLWRQTKRGGARVGP